jgi:hypothetical protein
MACFRVACRAFPAIRASVISRHGRTSPPHHVHRAPKHRPALEPWIADIPTLGRYRPGIEVRVQHLHDRFNLDHLRPQFVAALGVGLDLPGQLGMKLDQGMDGLFDSISARGIALSPSAGDGTALA